MADVARTAIVSNENHKGVLVDEQFKNSPNDGSNDITCCSESNNTNNFTNRHSCSESKDQCYQEIDSFSELSFKTSDEISLQDLIESEFAARISTINCDEFGSKVPNEYWSTEGHNETTDTFDDLFDDYMSDKEKTSPKTDEVDCHPKNVVRVNLHEFISEPMQGDDYRITEDKNMLETKMETNKSVNIFKLDRPNDLPILTNFDPFTAVEEDSDCSNSNVLISPDEFPVSNLVGKTKESEVAEDKFVEKSQDHSDDNIIVNKTEDLMREIFTKTISDEVLDGFTEQNFEDDKQSNFHVVNNMSSVESINNSFASTSNLTSPDKIEVEEFFSSEDYKRNGEPLSETKNKLSTDKNTNFESIEAKDLEQTGKVELFIDDEDFEDFPKAFTGKENGVNVNGHVLTCEESKWTTVEKALKAQPENFELEGDLDVTNATNECINNFSENFTNNEGLTTSQVIGMSGTESESESSEKKTVKKKKSKKGKSSDEKENISMDYSPVKNGRNFTPALENNEDFSNVSVKNLMLTYSTEAPKSLQTQWCYKDADFVPIENLKARSMLDLTTNCKKMTFLQCNLLQNTKNIETSRSTTNLTSVGKHPVVTGISVQALKERYCSMINLSLRTFSYGVIMPKNRKKICVPWSEALKSSFSKFDQLSKKTVLHVRSVDASKVQKQFNEASTGVSEGTSNCKSCGKQVFQMEQIKAEKSVWHKNCFRCKECKKQLSVDTYSSHEGILYCKPHFKELFKPKAVLEDDSEPIKLRKPEIIIRENQPLELPPEVVRASDKPDLGLEELASLNLKSRYQVFEKSEETESLERSPSAISVKRSPSILSKLVKFQKKGMDVGVKDEDLNGLPIEQSSSSSEEEEEEEEESVTTKKIIKCKKGKERPMSFSKLGDVKSVWESGVPKTKEELREERKAEIHQIRSKLFMGKQVKMKEAYEQAVRESENISCKKSIDVRSEKAKSIKECFEKGEPLNVDDENENEEKKKIVEDDMSLFEAGISKKSRSLFLEMDKTAKNQQQISSVVKKPSSDTKNREVSRQPSENVVKSSDAVEDVQIETADISSKFKFFETYKEPEREKKQFRITPPREGQLKTESPEKEIYRDPNVVRASDKVEQEIIRTNTTAKMLSLFRQMEEKTEEIPEGPKPLKRFTPPPDYKNESEGESQETEESEEEEEEEINTNIIRASDKVEDEYLKQAASAARAKQLKAKFEKWEEKEKEREREELMNRKVNGTSSVNTITENSENIEVTSIECTKSLRARFESMKEQVEQPKEKFSRPKVNRFVEIQNNMAELCDVCRGRVYQLEKIETSGKIFHKTCFRCIHCKCLLRMESFTLNCGNLYCLPHFKQKFISKGNYDEGFGVDQHKTKWHTVTSF